MDWNGCRNLVGCEGTIARLRNHVILVYSYLQLMDDLLFKTRETSLWLGGTSILCNWLHICKDKCVYSLCCFLLNVELIFFAFYSEVFEYLDVVVCMLNWLHSHFQKILLDACAFLSC